MSVLNYTDKTFNRERNYNMRKNTELERFKQYRVARNYSEYTFEHLYKIFCTYRDRGGILPFKEFALIPIARDLGDITNEPGTWPKYIRKRLAEQGCELLE